MAWGGATELVPVTDCDKFLFEHCTSMLNILTSPIVDIVGSAPQFVPGYPTPPGTSCDLGILSGDLTNPAFSTNNAYITAVPVSGIDDVFTLEMTVLQEELPNDFSDIVNRHFFFGVTDRTGPCAGIFVSKAGFAYAGAIHHVPGSPSAGDLVLDSAFEQIPGTAANVLLGEYVTYRMSVSGVTGAVYFYATRTADLGVIGHQLIAVLPVIDASELSYTPPEDRAIVSVRGTHASPTRIAMDRWCLSSSLVIANILPVANAGQDQAIRMCSIAQLDGSASFDPEGAPLLYEWRLIDAPGASEFAEELYDGKTYALLVPTGFTDKFHSPDLAAIDAVDPVLEEDVITIQGESYSIIAKGVDGNGFFVQMAAEILPDNLSAEPFKFLRQRGISNRTSAIAAFYPDTPGFYKFDLVVFDGSLYSDPSVAILNVLESSLPRGCIPDLKYINEYISDFWALVEDFAVMETLWSALAQVTATELYTLWQYEYSKSLRDIQRSIVRRWLHYDLLLAEPIPELTRIRTLWSGVESSQIPAAGNPAIQSTSLVLSSPAFEEDQTIDFVTEQTPQQVHTVLVNKLAGIDSRFSVELIPENVASPTFYVVRIDAPFPFTVDDSSTIPVFTADDTSGVVEGTGAANGVRTYLVDKSLQGLPIQEDDLLVLEGVGYRIVRVVDGDVTDPDDYPQQRVVLKDDLPVPASTDWKIGSHVTSELLDFYNGMVSVRDDVFLEVDGVADEVQLVNCEALGASEALPSLLSFDAAALGEYIHYESAEIRLAKVVRGGYFPISDLIRDIPTFQEFIVIEDDEAVLRRNVDFFLEEYRGASAIRFAAPSSPDIWEGEVPPDRLWAEYTYVDNSPAIEANFGVPADFTLDELEALPETVDYLSAVRGLWFVYFGGPTMYNLRVGTQIFLGLPFAEVAGTIEEIRTDFSPNEGRMLVRDTASVEIVRSYRFPIELELEVNPETGERYAVGDAVAQFAPLVEGVEIIDYVTDPQWFQGLMNQGVFEEVQKYHTFTVRVDSEAFSLTTLSLVQDFIIKARPQHTYPIFVVSFSPDIDDIDVLDTIEYEGTLHLNDGVCGRLGAGMYDDARPGGEGLAGDPRTDSGWWNQFDTSDGGTPPAGPPADPVEWAYDKGYLCPEDSLTGDLSREYDGATDVHYDSVFNYDTPVTYLAEAVDTPGSPPSIPDAPSQYDLPGSTSAPLDGEIKEVRVLIVGGPGIYATDYELVVKVAGTIEEVIPVTVDELVVAVDVDVSGSLVTASDAITFGIRIPSGSSNPGTRTPPWTYMRGRAFVENGDWAFDDPPETPGDVHTPPAGIYVVRDLEIS